MHAEPTTISRAFPVRKQYAHSQLPAELRVDTRRPMGASVGRPEGLGAADPHEGFRARSRTSSALSSRSRSPLRVSLIGGGWLTGSSG